MKRKFCVAIAWCLFWFLPAMVAAEGSYRTRVETGVRTQMDDGVGLVADIYRPDASGTFPCLLRRTPYNRKGTAEQAGELASYGYIVVVQDTRGRFDSEGEFYPFRHETKDGYQTVEWVAELPGSNGRVAMYGGSYVGATQMLAAIGRPPHLVAVFPNLTASEYYDGWTYQSGAFMQWFASTWTTNLSRDTLRRKIATSARQREWSWLLPLEDNRLFELPSVREVAPYYRDWILHESEDGYWKRWKVSEHYAQLAIKGLHAGGWHDIFLKGSIQNYLGMRASARTGEARESQRLLIGPWAHAATSPEGKIGDVVFGKQAVLDMTETIRNWSDWALKGIQNQYAGAYPVRLFIMGENIWRNEKDFPLARQRLTRYFLHSSRGANSIAGDGRLSTRKPGRGAPDVFEYDPAKPVPTIGGRLCCSNRLLPPGPFDQSPNETREDVLVYSTPPLASSLEVTGFIKLELFASTTAPDTDFTAMLVDVDPSGYSRYLTDGIVRARYRNSTAHPELPVAGKVHRYEIDLWATGNVFKAGHRIRLYLSSSNFPRFNRNLNTGEPLLGATRAAKATQSIYHDSEYPSALILPVIPR